MDLSIISVNWNSVDYLLTSIASIYEWTSGISFEVIVVDNASPVGNVDILKERFPEITIIKSPSNLGFAAANNLGFLNSKGQCVLFLNPDTRLAEPAIGTIMEQLSALPDVGIVGCRLLNGDLSLQTSSIMKFPRILNRVFQVESLRLRWPQLWGLDPLFSSDARPAQVEALSGACMLMKRQVFETIGMFDEGYFMYSEDLDLCYKAIRSGLNNYYVGTATIIHYGGKSSPRPEQTAMKTKAELAFCAKHYGPLYAFALRVSMILNAAVRLAILGAYRLCRKMFRLKDVTDSTWSRWRVMFRTLVAFGNLNQSSLNAPTSRT